MIETIGITYRSMNLRDLKYLVAVADLRHFGRAAEACFVSQPTLSGQIKKLEDELGVTLFERDNKSVVATPAGEAIVRHARLALEQVDAITELAQAHRDPLAEPLRLGVIPTLAPYLMPLVLRPLRDRYPKLRLVVSEELTASLVQRLRRHEIDAALVATDERGDALAALPLFVEPFWLAVPRRHALANAGEVSVSDLDTGELMLLADGHCLADQARTVCGARAADALDTSDLRASSLETLLQLVGAGQGTTLVPALALRGSWTTDAGVIARPLAGRDAQRTVRLVYRRSYPRVAVLEALADVIVENLPNTVKPLRGSPRPRRPADRTAATRRSRPPRRSSRTRA
jgi:LysR family transcriptional regulator, hydrogen peroxide-inducible genes activator